MVCTLKIKIKKIKNRKKERKEKDLYCLTEVPSSAKKVNIDTYVDGVFL